MTIEIPAPGVEGEGPALPPPRTLTEPNTLTVGQGSRASATGWDMLDAGWIERSGDSRPMRVAIVPADPTALTLTF
ncbi:MAG TPA: hypothetical protein VIR81_14940 [Myxococcales bacterium]